MGQETAKLNNIRPSLPAGIEKFDETFGKKLQVYKDPFLVFVDAKVNSQKPVHLEVTLQGCAEAGICYPPMTLKLLLSAPGVKVSPIPEGFSQSPELGAQDLQSSEFSLSDLWRERDDVNGDWPLSRKCLNPLFIFSLLCFRSCLGIYALCIANAADSIECDFWVQDGKAISKGRASTLAFAYVLRYGIGVCAGWSADGCPWWKRAAYFTKSCCPDCVCNFASSLIWQSIWAL
jgi:thiol:disulfide interchange protein DsbD